MLVAGELSVVVTGSGETLTSSTVHSLTMEENYLGGFSINIPLIMTLFFRLSLFRSFVKHSITDTLHFK